MESSRNISMQRQTKNSISKRSSSFSPTVGKMSLYIKNIISKRLTIPIKFIGSNISSIIENILKDNFGNKCSIEGFIKKDSIKVITFSCGNVQGSVAIFTVIFEYLVCNPPQGMRISCAVKNITNAGILARIDDTEYSPLNIFIARDHHYNIPYFSELKEGDIIMVKVIGQRFELNDTFVSVIAELELKRERESATSIRHQIESAQKKGSKLSVILEESSNLLGEFPISEGKEKEEGEEESEGQEGQEEEEEGQEEEEQEEEEQEEGQKEEEQQQEEEEEEEQ
jgi:DNA-directed RNA polymerase subunit E'/Rpb7